ncbi:MAG: hypothetical protein SH807_07030 [Blastochloris sp.]|nr:hypothetical protein [Blastochloris sp.]
MQNNNLFNFIENQLLRTSLFLRRLPLAHIGWWMGFRAGWKQDDRRIFIAGLACLLASWGAITFLASDLTRSTNLLIPCCYAALWL